MLGLAISRVIASLFSISFDEALDYFVGALKSRADRKSKNRSKTGSCLPFLGQSLAW